MMLISSPPCGPFSVSQISPVSGCTRQADGVANAEREDLRLVARLRPTNGLSAGVGAVVVQPQDLAEVLGRVLRVGGAAGALVEARARRCAM